MTDDLQTRLFALKNVVGNGDEDTVQEAIAELASLQLQLEYEKRMYTELRMSFHWAECEMKRVRQAALKLPRPWMDGNIDFEEWIAAVDKVLEGMSK